MSIEKESNGVPEVDFRRWTTKVNLALVVGVAAFLGACALAIWWFANRG